MTGLGFSLWDSGHLGTWGLELRSASTEAKELVLTFRVLCENKHRKPNLSRALGVAIQQCKPSGSCGIG